MGIREVVGAYATAKVFADDVEDYAVAQIRMICDDEAAEGSRIRVMPDVHPGKVGPIGPTSTARASSPSSRWRTASPCSTRSPGG